MPGLLKISDTKRGRGSGLAFDISDLLGLISDEGPRLTWSIFPGGEGTFITGDFSGMGMDAAEFWQKVDASETGIILPWSHLVAFAEAIQQTNDGTYIGCKDADTFTSLALLYLDEWCYVDRASPAYYEAVEIVFQAIDSSFWLVYSRNDTVVQHIRNAFHDVETLRAW